MGCYLTPAGGYYEGDRVSALDADVPQRPSPYSTWDGTQWITPSSATIQDMKAQSSIDAEDRLLFEINFDQENRIRAIEGKEAITRAQYRDALVARWKQLNP
jgi:hypothetical protein